MVVIFPVLLFQLITSTVGKQPNSWKHFRSPYRYASALQSNKTTQKRSAPMRNPLNHVEIYYGTYIQPWKQLGDIPVFTRLNWGNERMNITPPKHSPPPTTPPSLPCWVRPMDAGRHTGTQQWSTHCIFIQAEQAAAQPSHSADQRQKISPLHRHSSVHLQTRIVLHVATHAHILAW